MRVDRRVFLKSAAALAAAACGRPAEPCEPKVPGTCAGQGLPGDGYFEQLGRDLTAADCGTPQIIVDLDRLDANADAIVAGAGKDRYRIVEKSLPSLDLLDYVHARTGSDRFLVLHLPFLPPLLEQFPTARVLIGKPHPIGAVRRLFAGLSDRAGAAARVTFLADTVDRLNELIALAGDLSLQLQVAVELDVGLHRGGVRRPSELGALLSIFQSGSGRVRFAGTLGYDGHVCGAPATPGLEERAARAAFQTSQAAYQSFVDVLKSDFGPLLRDDLVFNSGGSSTFPLYTRGPVNDVASGGGMLRPSVYSGPFTGALSPAVFIASPVLAHFDKLELPYVTNLSEGMSDHGQGFTLFGGGWAASFVFPAGLAYAPFVSDGTNVNLVPSESWCMSPENLAMKPGDWVFLQPREADAIFQFQDILLVRGGRLQPQTFRAYPRRY